MAIPNKTYKPLLSEKNFLRVAQRARKISGISIVEISFKQDTVYIKCNSATTKGVQWTQRIQIVNLLEHRKFEKVKQGVEEGRRDFASHARKAMIRNFKDPVVGRKLEQSILASPIRVHCNCPAFLYWGFQYISYKKGYGLVPEHRRPRVRNPRQQGFLCKHLYAVLSIWPLLAKSIARKYKFDSSLDWNNINS